jgi:hypothetical protein
VVTELLRLLLAAFEEVAFCNLIFTALELLVILYFRFKPPEPLLLHPVLLFILEHSEVGVDKGDDIIPPIPESSIDGLSDDAGDDRGMRWGCNGTDNGETKVLGLEVDTKFEISGPKPWLGGGGGKN